MSGVTVVGSSERVSEGLVRVASGAQLTQGTLRFHRLSVSRKSSAQPHLTLLPDFMPARTLQALSSGWRLTGVRLYMWTQLARTLNQAGLAM